MALFQIFQIYKVISPIPAKTGGLLAVARCGRFLYACSITLIILILFAFRSGGPLQDVFVLVASREVALRASSVSGRYVGCIKHSEKEATSILVNWRQLVTFR